jgi:large-conductance mechanosensitive channel
MSLDKSPEEYLNYSNFFYRFLKKNDIISLSVAAVFSGHINDLINSIVNNIFIPIINRDGDKDGKKDIQKIETIKVNLFGCNITIGKLVVDLLKFILVTIVIYSIVYKLNLYK